MTQRSQNLTSLPSTKWSNRSCDQSLKCHTSPPLTRGGGGGGGGGEGRRLNREEKSLHHVAMGA